MRLLFLQLVLKSYGRVVGMPCLCSPEVGVVDYGFLNMILERVGGVTFTLS